jgi:hypothetical protein
MQEKLRTLEFDKVILEGKANGSPLSAFFSLDSKLTSERMDLVERCNIPTRLKKLEKDELDALIEHASHLTIDRVRKYLVEGGVGESVVKVRHAASGMVEPEELPSQQET